VLGLRLFSRTEGLDKRLGQYSLGLQLIACHIEGQSEDAMPVALIDITLDVSRMLLHLTGSYDSARVVTSHPFQIEHIPSALSVYELVIWKAHETENS
jgi:hypothetical protein